MDWNSGALSAGPEQQACSELECGRMSLEELGESFAGQPTKEPLAQIVSHGKYNSELSGLHPFYGTQPQVRILTRKNNTNPQHQRLGPKQSTQFTPHTLTLQERERQYEEARRRILGPNS